MVKKNNISDLIIANECSCGDLIVEEQENHASLQHVSSVFLIFKYAKGKISVEELAFH